MLRRFLMTANGNMGENQHHLPFTVIGRAGVLTAGVFP